MTPFIESAFSERKIGLALHYPFLHSAIVGIGAKHTFEFGAGGSTHVFLDAQKDVGALHVSISTASREDLVRDYLPSYERYAEKNWRHIQGKSEASLDMSQYFGSKFDLVLHDGSHTAEVVASDVAWAWSRLKKFGLLLVHDTQHSHCGADMRQGLRAGLDGVCAKYSSTTLPFGFGLTVVRREDGNEQVTPAVEKVGSAHTTLLEQVLG